MRIRKLLTLTALFPLVATLLGSCAAPSAPRFIGTPTEPALLADHAVMDDSYVLPLQRWQPESEPRAVVVALHGFNDYRRAFETVGPYLAERGVITYAYDQRGFGATASRGGWDGDERMVRDARVMVELLRQAHPDLPVYLLGESMGGAVTLSAAAGEQRALVDGVVLVAPAVWARQTMPWYQRIALSVVNAVAPNWQPSSKTVQKVARKPSDNNAMLREIWQDPLMIRGTRIAAVNGLADLMDRAQASAPKLRGRALILYGERDEIVPKQPVCQMLGRLPDDGSAEWQLGLYPNGYHMLTRDLQAEVVLEDIAHWILAGDGQLPSGQKAGPERWQQEVCQA